VAPELAAHCLPMQAHPAASCSCSVEAVKQEHHTQWHVWTTEECATVLAPAATTVISATNGAAVSTTNAVVDIVVVWKTVAAAVAGRVPVSSHGVCCAAASPLGCLSVFQQPVQKEPLMGTAHVGHPNHHPNLHLLPPL